MKQHYLLGLLIIITCNTFAQTYPGVPVFSTPSPATLGNYGYGNAAPTHTLPANASNQVQLQQYVRDRAEQIRLQQQQAAASREVDEWLQQQARNRAVAEAVQYEFPLPAPDPERAHFEQAFRSLTGMLSGKQTASLKQAVHTVENAYAGNTYAYADFSQAIQAMAQTCTWKLQQDGYGLDNHVAKLRAIHQFMSDTIQVKHPATGKPVTHYPFRYDFEDFLGKDDWTKMFVSKLIRTRSGQCHSLPLLYLLIAEELHTPAYLAFAPSHTYVKFQDEHKQWTNLELTIGKITSDYFIIGSGYIKAEALRSRIYMQPLSLSQTVAQSLAELGQGYAEKFGFDAFVLSCVETSLQYFPNNIYAIQLRANYYEQLLQYVATQLNYPPSLRSYPQAVRILEQRNALHQQVADLGYAEMPKEAYEAWLHSVEEEKRKQAAAK